MAQLGATLLIIMLGVIANEFIDWEVYDVDRNQQSQGLAWDWEGLQHQASAHAVWNNDIRQERRGA